MTWGRDLILELSAETAGKLALQTLRRERAAQCFTTPGGLLPNWPTAVAFRQTDEGGTALITVTTAAGAVTLQVPIDGYLGLAGLVTNTDLNQLLALFDAQVDEIGSRALSNGALAIGLDLTGGLSANSAIWSSFDTDFLTINNLPFDWAIEIDRAFLEAALAQRLDVLLDPLRNSLPEGSRVHPPRVTWGNPIGVVLDIATPGIKPGAVIYVDVLLQLDAEHQLILDLVSVNVDLTGIANVFDVGPFDEAIDNIARKFILQQLAQAFAPVSLNLRIGPQATLTATTLRASEQGLIIAGSAFIIVPRAPELAVNPSAVVFMEEAATACARSEPPKFGEQIVSIQNGGAGTLFLCSVDVQGTGFSIVGLAEPPIAGLRSGQNFPLRIAYVGSRAVDASGVLRVQSNDPTRPVATFPLRALAAAQPKFHYSPDPLEIRVANTRSGSYLEDDFDAEPCQPWLRGRSLREPPAAFITISNIGEGPGYICAALVEDHSGTFDVDPIGPYTLLPGHSVQVGVRYFPQTVGDDHYTFIDIDTPTGTHVVRVHARVDPSRQSMPLDVGRTNQQVQHGIDLISEIVCSGSPLHRCSVRALFEPSRGPQIDSVDIGPVRPGGRVELIGDGGDLVGWDSLDQRYVQLIDEWVDDPGFTGNWCIARLTGVPALELAAVHMALGSWALENSARVAVAGSRAIAGVGGWLYVAARDEVLVVDWRDPVRPIEHTSFAIPGPVSLACDQQTLAIGAGHNVLLYDLQDPATPRLRAELKAGAEVLLVRMLSQGFVAATKRGIMTEYGTLQLPAAPDALCVSGSSLIVTSEAGIALLGGRNFADLAVLDADATQSAAETLSVVGDRVHVVRKGTTHIYSTHGELRCVGERSYASWSSRFSRDGSGGIYSIDADGVRRWQLQKRKIERSHFRQAFKLRYAPERQKRFSPG